MGYQLIETVTVGSGGASSIQFTSIPQDGVDLLLVVSLRQDTSSRVALLRFNNDSGANYAGIRLLGDGTSAFSNTITNTQLVGLTTTSSQTANTFANESIYISNYTSSTSKSVSADGVQENNATSSIQQLFAGRYTTTSPITVARLSLDTGLLLEHSSASLYKIL